MTSISLPEAITPLPTHIISRKHTNQPPRIKNAHSHTPALAHKCKHAPKHERKRIVSSTNTPCTKTYVRSNTPVKTNKIAHIYLYAQSKSHTLSFSHTHPHKHTHTHTHGNANKLCFLFNQHASLIHFRDFD